MKKTCYFCKDLNSDMLCENYKQTVDGYCERFNPNDDWLEYEELKKVYDFVKVQQ